MMRKFMMPPKKERHPVLRLLKMLLRLFYRRHAIRGADQVTPGQPAVFVCNHALSYGPIVITLDLPFCFRPWVQASVVSPELCRDYLEDDFVQKELKLKPPVSHWLASLLAPLCLRLMKAIGAVPVYKGRMRIRETIQASVLVLKEGWNLVIFPEDKTRPYSAYINDFNTGFTYLAKQYYLATGQSLHFHPVFIDHKKHMITIGPAIIPMVLPDAKIDWKNLAFVLRNTVNDMAMNS
jgi:1-acyl-sn-glycerol-3-phosphate acyltransferase